MSRKYPPEGPCRVCGKPARRKGPGLIYQCYPCGLAKMRDNILQIHAKSGPYFENYVDGVLKSAGRAPLGKAMAKGTKKRAGG